MPDAEPDADPGTDPGSGTVGTGSDPGDPTGSDPGDPTGSDPGDPGSGGGDGSDTFVPFTGTVSVSDDSGDSESETVTTTRRDDGGFTLTVSISDSYGSDPATNPGPDANGDINTNGGKDTATISFDVGVSTTVATLVEDDSDTYSDSETLSGPTGSGTWKASGKDKYHEDETVTLNSDGTGSESDDSDSTSTDKYHLTLTTTLANGMTLTDDDSGKDDLTSSDTESDDSDDNDSETLNDNVNSTETTTFDESGGGVDEGGTSTETVDFLDAGSDLHGTWTETNKTSDDGTDSDHYQSSGTFSDGASYNVTDAQADKYDDSETITAGSGANTTDVTAEDGSNSNEFAIALTNVNDEPGATSAQTGTSDSLIESTSQSGTTHLLNTLTTDPTGALVEDDEDVAETEMSSDDQSGSDLDGPYSDISSATFSDEITSKVDPSGYEITGDTESQSPPNRVVTGTPPGQYGAGNELERDFYLATMPAYSVSGGDVAAIVATMTIAPNAPPDSSPPAPADPPTQQEVTDRKDFDDALKVLQTNADFSNLYKRVRNNISYLPLTTNNPTTPGLLGLTKGTYSTRGTQYVQIYLNSMEFKVMRATDPANYQRLLQETITHETIHAYCFMHTDPEHPTDPRLNRNDLKLWHDPSSDNMKDTGYGSLETWMSSRYRPNDANRSVLGDYRKGYVGGFMDIDRNAQALVKKIVP